MSVCKVADPSGPSLLGDPAEFGTDDPNEDTCPLESLVGTVQTVSRTRTGGGTAITTLTEGDIYNGETTGGEPGRLLIVLRPLCSAGSPVAPGSPTCTAVLGSAALQVEKSFLTARASIVERGGGNYGIDVDTFDIKSGADEPLSPTVDVLAPVGGSLVRAGKAPIQVQRLTQTLFGSADQGTAAAADDLPFVTLPTSCSLKTLSSDAMTWVDNTVLSGQATFTTTGCPIRPVRARHHGWRRHRAGGGAGRLQQRHGAVPRPARVRLLDRRRPDPPVAHQVADRDLPARAEPVGRSRAT